MENLLQHHLLLVSPKEWLNENAAECYHMLEKYIDHFKSPYTHVVGQSMVMYYVLLS
jgi:hypothetical protein